MRNVTICEDAVPMTAEIRLAATYVYACTNKAAIEAQLSPWGEPAHRRIRRAAEEACVRLGDLLPRNGLRHCDLVYEALQRWETWPNEVKTCDPEVLSDCFVFDPYHAGGVVSVDSVSLQGIEQRLVDKILGEDEGRSIVPDGDTLLFWPEVLKRLPHSAEAVVIGSQHRSVFAHAVARIGSAVRASRTMQYIAVSADGYWNNELGWTFEAKAATRMPTADGLADLLGAGVAVLSGKGASLDQLPSFEALEDQLWSDLATGVRSGHSDEQIRETRESLVRQVCPPMKSLGITGDFSTALAALAERVEGEVKVAHRPSHRPAQV